MGNKQQKIEEEKRKQKEADERRAAENRKRAEEQRKKAEEERRKQELINQLAKLQNEEEARRRREEYEREVERRRRLEIEREREERERRRREEEERRENERKIREKNENDINKFRNDQNIAKFLELIERFSDDCNYMRKTLEALDEDKLIKNYKDFKDTSQGKIEIIKEAIKEDNDLNNNCQRKLIIILLCNEKNKGTCDRILEILVDDSNKKKLLFNILLDYNKIFGEDIKFKRDGIYKEFVDYSLEVGKYMESLDYKNNDFIQLQLIYENIDRISRSYTIEYKKLNDYRSAYELIEKLINYQKEKGKKFIYFPKNFWEKYYYHYNNLENEEKKIEKMVGLYKLLLSYIDLEKDDTEYKEILAGKIHEFIEIRIEKLIIIEQLKLLFEIDPYYVYPCEKRDPKIFEKIKIFDLKDEQDIKYFHKIGIEKVYESNINDFLDVIINKTQKIDDFNSIIQIIELKDEDNKNEYIKLLKDRYRKFNEEILTNESFINLLGKVNEYIPKQTFDLLEEFLPRFGKKNYSIYIDILEKFKDVDYIEQKIPELSIKNLDLSSIIDLINKIKDEKQKIMFFNNIEKNIITYKDFIVFEASDKIKLLTELMKFGLIQESFYLDKNKNELNIIYDKLTTYDEKQSIYLDTIINENEGIQKIYCKRFELFKLIKGDKYDWESEFNKIKNKYIEIKKDIELSHFISDQMSLYFKETLKEEIDKINNIYKDYSDKDKNVNLWIYKEKEIISFKIQNEEKANLIKEIKEIQLFQIIYGEITEENEISKFNKAVELLNECKVIFSDIQKGNPDILKKWQNKFRKGTGVDEELEKLREYFKIKNDEGLDKVAKKTLIFTKKNIYEFDIKCILYFLKLFDVDEGELSEFLKNSQTKFEDKDNLSFESLEEINNKLEDKKIYINGGKNDSSSIQLIRLFYEQEDKINFIKSKDVDAAQALLYKLNPTTDSLKFDDILEYQSCIAFIKDINQKSKDIDLINKLMEKIEKDDIKKLLSQFKSYFKNYGSIKNLDSNFDNDNDIYENIKDILKNSEYKFEFFRREFIVYDNNRKEKTNLAKDLDGLIQLKDNINTNFEEIPTGLNEERKKELLDKQKKITIFVKYVNQLQNINKYFKKLENKGCPFLIDILIKVIEDKIIIELVNEVIEYNSLIYKLKQFCFALVEFQSKFYKDNQYFRYVYDKQLYRLFKRIVRKNKDISSYIRFFTNGDSINDEVPLHEGIFADPAKAYKDYKFAINENYNLISNYIKNLFDINKTSLKDLYEKIKVKDSRTGIYKCNVKKYNMDIFIIKMFLKITGNFPIAQNILLTNNETSTGEIYSFMYRAIKCNYNTLFIISISDDFSTQNLNIMTSLLDKIIKELKSEKKIKEIKDLKPCILFITQNEERYKNLADAEPLEESFKGDENDLEYKLQNTGSIESNLSAINKIYNTVKVYTSDCCGLGKSYRIKKDISQKNQNYYYFGVGDDITKEELFKKLKRFLKYEIKGKFNVAIHLDLFYTKNTPLMKYFLFAMLITKLYQANDNILYIPKDINIYVEIPNGPFKFLDDYPILTIFETINITKDDQLSLNTDDKEIIKNLIWDENQKFTYIEKSNYMKIIKYLANKDIINYNEKIKGLASLFTNCVYSETIRKLDISQKEKEEKERKNYIYDFYNFDEQKALNIQEAPLIFKTKDGYLEINISNDENKDKKDIKYFLSNLKKIMSLEESEEDLEKLIGDYRITADNYKKMILILFRMFANIPVILMGETGCGKTELIKQLMKMLNKDKDKENNNFIIKNMHSGVTEEEIIEVIEKAEKNLNLKESKNDMICIFFDEINTTSLLSKMKEIFVNHSLNGKIIDQRIRFIGACNPFRRNKKDENEEGLKLEKIDGEEEMTYMVNPLPNSLLNYVFYFKSLEDNDAKEYIESIIGTEFPKGENDDSNNSFLRNIAIESIHFSHNYVRKYNGISSVSLRDLQRFRRAYKFFNKYYEYKKEFLKTKIDGVDMKSKVQSFVSSLFITYFIKIFKFGLETHYLQTINDYVKQLGDKFKIDEWSTKNVKLEGEFKYIIREEEEFLLKEMEIEKEPGIGLNNSLKQNIFLMFFAIYSYIPLIVVGKPGCSKSLSIQLIIRIMRGELSSSKFLKNFPTINSTGFQGSETNTPESIENIFKEAEKKVDLSQIYIPDSIELILKEAEEKVLTQSNIFESLDYIFKEVENNIELNKLNISESLKKIYEKYEGRLMIKSNNPEIIKNIYIETKEKIDLNQINNLEKIIKETEEKILKLSNIPESLKNIFKEIKNNIDLNKLNVSESLKKIYEKLKGNNPEINTDIYNKEKIDSNKLYNDEETIKNIFKATKEKIYSNKLNNHELIKNIFKEAEEKMINKLKVIESIKNIFKDTKDRLDDLNKLDDQESIKDIFKETRKQIFDQKYLSLLVFDELGLSERSPTNCLKVLHSKLEMSLDPKEQKQISFIGISNWRLDAAKMNRTIFLAIPDITKDDILLTVKAIADSYDKDLYNENKYQKIYNLLGNTYYFYKKMLKGKSPEKNEGESENDLKDKDNIPEEYLSLIESNKNKIDEFIINYHGGRDLYNLIKIFSSEMIKNKKTDDTKIIEMAVKKTLARNFSGLEINGESTLKKYISEISKLNFDELKTIDLIKENIRSKDTRFLLLASEKSMFSFLIDMIKEEIENYVAYIGSPFKGDKINTSYQREMIGNIEKSVEKGKVIILSDLDQIYSTFYDLFNQNYIIKDGKKYCRISHGGNVQKLAPVNENTKFIVLVDKNNLRKQKLPFLSRFEKHIISFDNLLNEKDKEKSETINDILKKLVTVKDINYNLDNILVNTNKDIINGYIYLYQQKYKDQYSYRDIIKDKILPILSQDIIFTMPLSELNNDKKEFDSLNNTIKDSLKKYNSLQEYLNNENKGKENILIVYTFSDTGIAIKLEKNEKYMERITTEINNVYKFKQILNEFFENKYKSLILKFEHENAKYINFFISEIKHYKDQYKEKYNTEEPQKFIFTINIKRESIKDKNKNKVTTILITDDKIAQLFIDNINRSEFPMKDVNKINIKDFIIKDKEDKHIIEEMLTFYREKKGYLGIYKSINTDNFIKEFKDFIEKSEEIRKNIKNIILQQIDNKEKISDLIIKNKSINQNTIDFITEMISHIKLIFNEKIKSLLKITENYNFLTTIFMLNVENKENTDSISTEYSCNINDNDILKNKIIVDIINEFFKLLREKKMETGSTENVNIKINYKIPGFFNIYKKIKSYIDNEKLAFFYRQDETELRKCEYELISNSIKKLEDDVKDFNVKLYSELTSMQLFNKVTEVKNIDKNYTDFYELFLNDYITFYLENLYNNNEINNFIINDIPHKIILLLLDLKFKDEEKCDKILNNIISKFLWLEANSKYIKDILNLYNIISDNIVYDEKQKNFLFIQMINYLSKKEIKYEPKEEQLKRVNIPFYKIIIILIKCLLDEQSVGNAAKKNMNDNYHSYFKNLEICLKEMQKLDKILKLNITELSALYELIEIYNAFEISGKVDKLDIPLIIANLTKSLDIIEKNDENKIKSLSDNLISLIENIKKGLYDSSKNNEIKGDIKYYDLIIDIFLNEFKRENNLEYKIYILNEFLLEDEKLFIQSNQLLKIILEDFASTEINFFQGSIEKLSNIKLKKLDENIKNEWIKETLIYTFEYISMIYIQNLINENDKLKKEYQKNIIYDLKSYLNTCIKFLEKLYKESFNSSNNSSTQIEESKEESNKNLKKLFSLAFTRVYLKVLIEWINVGLLSKDSEIEEIINIINGNEFNPFREMIQYFIYKIIYNLSQEEKEENNNLFDEKIIKKFHLKSYKTFEYLEKEKDKLQNPKDILFVEAYKKDDEDYKIYEDEFNKLSYYLNNGGEKENELKELINKNRLDIFYSVFSTKIGPYLNIKTDNDEKIKILSNMIQNIFYRKEKLLNIFELFLDKSKYTKDKITQYKGEILQYSLRFCLDADEISQNYNHIYYSLYNCNDKDINAYIPGNDIKDKKIYNSYIKIKDYLNSNPSYHGIYVCICNIHKDNEDINLQKVEDECGYPTKIENCKYCNEPMGNEGEEKGFYTRDYYYRIFKNKEDLDKETKNIKKGNCILLEDFYNKYIYDKLEEDSKGVNISNKEFFDKDNKPIRKQSQIGFRLMNLILYSHLFTNVLFTDKEEIFSDEKLSYLDYIVENWTKLENLLEKKGINNIYCFMNLIYKDLCSYLNKQEQIDNYQKFLEIENEIEKIIENKIFKKLEKIKDKNYSKYSIFLMYYNKNKNKFREKDSDSKTSLIKEINSVENYKDEKAFPNYKHFLYSDYLDKNFYKTKLENLDVEKYPVVYLYLNKEKIKAQLNKELIIYNFVIKSLLNHYSGKITKNEVKKLIFERSTVYKQYKKECDKFLAILNSKIKKSGKTLTKNDNLENFLIGSDGGFLAEIYKQYATNQNELLSNIIEKINTVKIIDFECQTINIQEAQKSDILTLEFENKSESDLIFLLNTSREIYNNNSKVKYNNYNSFTVDFDKIETIFENIFIKNACYLNVDEIVEMKYSGNEFLNDGIFEFNNKIKLSEILDKKKEILDEKDKEIFLKFYIKNLEDNIISCKEIDLDLKNIIMYLNNKYKDSIPKTKSIYDIINVGEFPNKINEALEKFLSCNKNFTVEKLSDLIIYLEKLYFDLIVKNEDIHKEYKEEIDEETKNKIDEYFTNKIEPLINKDKLSLTIMKFLINVFENKKNEETDIIDKNDNLFDYLNNKFLWDNKISKAEEFDKECEEYKKLDIKVKYSYELYKKISVKSKEKFEKEKNDILDIIKKEEDEQLRKEKEKKREEEGKKIEEQITINENKEEVEAVDIDEGDLDDLDAF